MNLSSPSFLLEIAISYVDRIGEPTNDVHTGDLWNSGRNLTYFIRMLDKNEIL